MNEYDFKNLPPYSLRIGKPPHCRLWEIPTWCADLFICTQHQAALLPVSADNFLLDEETEKRRRQWRWCCEATLSCKSIPESLLLEALAIRHQALKLKGCPDKTAAAVLRKARLLYLWLWKDKERYEQWLQTHSVARVTSSRTMASGIATR